jgi:hypothetical protein
MVDYALFTQRYLRHNLPTRISVAVIVAVKVMCDLKSTVSTSPACVRYR